MTPPAPAVSAPREILRRLHEIMASRLDAQVKLNEVVQAIATALNSEVCSIYVLRDGALELFATQGLQQSAVHVTRLDFGEGLVGFIGKSRVPLHLAEARAHPQFVYRPETGEDLFHSFAGVPILRREQAVGVVAVQHAESRDYDPEEIEALQTVAMVLSELIASAGLIDDASVARVRDLMSGPQRLEGFELVSGLARGVAVYHQPHVEILHIVAEDVEVEKDRVRAAFQTMRVQLDRMMSQAEFAGAGEHQDILETYKMFAYDEGWARRITEAIDSGLTAEAAIEKVQRRTRIRMQETPDPYLRERLHDLDDLSNRLLRIVAGKMGTAAHLGLERDTILIARNLGPAELLEYDRKRLKGVVLEEGSPTAHVTIIARAMGVPMLGRCRAVRTMVAEGDPLLLNANEAALFVRPQPEIVRQFEAHIALQARQQARYAALRDLPATSLDGQRVELMVNAGLRVDLPGLELTNADGIGLFRTEFQFLVSAALPRREAQTQLYRDVLNAANGKPVIFRTVDIGGDKAVAYMREGDAEENPAMGWRALRLSLERDGLLRVQARALVDACAGENLYLMFPMISEPWEYEAARAVVEEQLVLQRERGHAPPKSVSFGAMLEVPGLAQRLDILLPRLDFLSIGTNDLVQFLFAADRSHPKLSNRYDWLSLTLLRFLRDVVRACDAAKVPVSVCGEMGGRPLEALALMALGVRRLSITPAAVGPIRALVRSVNLQDLHAHMTRWLDAPDTPVRVVLTALAQEVGADISFS